LKDSSDESGGASMMDLTRRSPSVFESLYAEHWRKEDRGRERLEGIEMDRLSQAERVKIN
jgi:hypothetical protein